MSTVETLVSVHPMALMLGLVGVMAGAAVVAFVHAVVRRIRWLVRTALVVGLGSGGVGGAAAAVQHVMHLH
ncbi:hypothetical protein [Mycolicibacterium aubagnense]|uniref:Uncharacterized protein n=1 Tax=Mycolicibacterium aubagnense TaxID=319707 RepID=A0ABM7IN72_9MYCO|nr:hypothetical protein [Mycolicibacterium aubagnense]TLH49089.1 hypothetical protein C1S80_29160 [Mycolicibacterium aubagnense]BBX88253.1 hypothetical protein MAUB_64540 [Mycolicibacterium aubagnense]